MQFSLVLSSLTCRTYKTRELGGLFGLLHAVSLLHCTNILSPDLSAGFISSLIYGGASEVTDLCTFLGTLIINSRPFKRYSNVST